MNSMMTFMSVVFDWIYIPLLVAYCWFALVKPSLKRQKRAIKFIIAALIVASFDMFADLILDADDWTTALNIFDIIICIANKIMAEYTLRRKVEAGEWY